MASWSFASRVTQLSGIAGGNTVELESGQPVRVWGFILTNLNGTAGDIITLRSADGTITYVEQALAATDSLISDIPFIADKGLEAVFSGATEEDLRVTIFHDAPGS